MTTFMLVHGTGCGGWVWQKVARLLRAEGNDVYTPTLTGVGDRSHLLKCGVDLNTHITDVANLLFYEDLSDVILVGHSYSGMVVSGVAVRAPERLAMVIYLDAYLPDAGQSEEDLWPAEMRAAIQADAATSGGLRPPPPPSLLGVSDPAELEFINARLTPHPMATYQQPAPPDNPKSAALRRAFIQCTVGQAVPVFSQFAAKARARGWPVRELETGHMAMLTAPNETAALLLDAAGGRF